MYNELFSYLREKDVKYKGNVNLSLLSSVKIGGEVKVGIFPNSIEQLVDVLRFLHSGGYPFCIIGKMTNLLADDRVYNGVAVFTDKIKGFVVNGNIVRITCGSMLSGVIMRLSEYSLGGLEMLCGIPGTLGGMIYSNAGAFGRELSDFFVSATVYDIKKDKIFTATKDQLYFSYRHSCFKDNKFLAVLDVSLSFEFKDKEIIKQQIKETQDKRKSTQPIAYPSLGSVFKRCGGVSVARLADECGIKGHMIGGAQISEKHAGFIVNIDNASSEDFRKMISFVKDKIHKCYGLTIEEEIEYFNFLP